MTPNEPDVCLTAKLPTLSGEKCYPVKLGEIKQIIRRFTRILMFGHSSIA